MLPRVLKPVVFAVYPGTRVGGVRVVFTDLEADRNAIATRIGDALAALAQIDEARSRMVERQLRHIMVWRGAHCSADSWGGMQLASSFAMTLTAPELASVILHEAVHLRIGRAGIKYSVQNRERIEKSCVRVQRRFLKDAGDAGIVMLEALDSAMKVPWWTDDARYETIRALFEREGIPPALAGLFRHRTV